MVVNDRAGYTHGPDYQLAEILDLAFPSLIVRWSSSLYMCMMWCIGVPCIREYFSPHLSWIKDKTGFFNDVSLERLNTHCSGRSFYFCSTKKKNQNWEKKIEKKISKTPDSPSVPLGLGFGNHFLSSRALDDNFQGCRIIPRHLNFWRKKRGKLENYLLTFSQKKKGEITYKFNRDFTPIV